jgi:hypothetical protein
MLVSKTEHELGSHAARAFGLYFASGVSLVWNWWQISKFLCLFDSGDLLNEFVLVLYMVLVVGQSFTVEPCAACLLSANLGRDTDRPEGIEGLVCGDEFGEVPSDWPSASVHCRLYIAFSVAARVLHAVDLLRATLTVQSRARREALLLLLEGVTVLPLWAAAAADGKHMDVVMMLWAAAAGAEVMLSVCEPWHVIHHLLEGRGCVAGVLERVPVNASFTEKRWHRLLMIALAMLPATVAPASGYSRKYEWPVT